MTIPEEETTETLERKRRNPGFNPWLGIYPPGIVPQLLFWQRDVVLPTIPPELPGAVSKREQLDRSLSRKKRQAGSEEVSDILNKILLAEMLVARLSPEQKAQMNKVASMIRVAVDQLSSSRQKRAIGTVIALIVATIVPLVTSLAVELPLGIIQTQKDEQQLLLLNEGQKLLLIRLEQLAKAQESQQKALLSITDFLARNGLDRKTASNEANLFYSHEFSPDSAEVQKALLDLEKRTGIRDWKERLMLHSDDQKEQPKREKRDAEDPELLAIKDTLLRAREISQLNMTERLSALHQVFSDFERVTREAVDTKCTVAYVTLAILVTLLVLSLSVIISIFLYWRKCSF